MANQRTFYVYVKFRPWDGSPCYVGKGQKKRAYRDDRTHNKHLTAIAKKAGDRLPTVIIRSGLTEGEAFEIERAFIFAIGRKANGGPLVNQTDGGDGVSGHKHSSETKRLCGDKSIKMWRDSRDRIIAAQNQGKSTPEFHAIRSAASTKTWSDPVRRSNMSKSKLAFFAENPEAKSLISVTTKAAMSTPAMSAKLSAGQKARFLDPEQKEKQVAINLEMVNRRWSRFRINQLAFALA